MNKNKPILKILALSLTVVFCVVEAGSVELHAKENHSTMVRSGKNLINNQNIAAKLTPSFPSKLSGFVKDSAHSYSKKVALSQFLLEHEFIIGITLGIAGAILFYFLSGLLPSQMIPSNLKRIGFSILFGVLSFSVSQFITWIFDRHYPLRPLTSQAIVKHPEREANIQKLKEALPEKVLSMDKLNIEKAYDAMVSDVVGRLQNDLLPEGFSSISHFVSNPFVARQSPFYEEEQKRKAPIKISITRDSLTVKRRHKMKEVYKLVSTHNNFDSLKVVIYKSGKEVEKDIATFFREYLKIPFERKDDIYNMFRSFEVGGLGIFLEETQQVRLFRGEFRPQATFGINGQLVNSSIGTQTLTISRTLMKRYKGKFLFSYHTHPSGSTKLTDFQGYGDVGVIREILEEFKYPIPEIIWAEDKEKEGKIIGRVHVPILHQSPGIAKPPRVKTFLEHSKMFTVITGLLFGILTYLLLIILLDKGNLVGIIIVASLFALVGGLLGSLIPLYLRERYPEYGDTVHVYKKFKEITLPVTIDKIEKKQTSVKGLTKTVDNPFYQAA